ncbi:DUF5798 family protein [Halobaculum lipolyticum]|uniref:DUF5798 family protein n=1 Tax=Halobaculum lipolyticum TaxID=3032001 RepID=A0ABD5WAW8_9EURY|nr:DUF5798 family protein [Halobaculum sp. DT31]
MGLGSTAKKLQTVADMAEKLYAKVNEIREQVESVQRSVETTETRVEALERESVRQRAVIEALAERQGVDVDAVLDDLDVHEDATDADDDGSEAATDDGSEDAGDDAGADAPADTA